MFMAVTLLGLISLIPYGASVFRTCIPNTQFQMNGRICYCDGLGQWSEANCEITRRSSCTPGQIIWEDCNQCICQENGQLQCISTACGDDKTAVTPKASSELDIQNLWCLPFVSYYINCSLCVCPASGKMSQARCATDASCPFEGSSDFLEAVKQNVCIPKVMYLFPCLQCHCSDEGFFLINKCVETCHKSLPNAARRCIPETLYRNECNICRCPENSIANEELCSKTKCSNRFKLYPLNNLKNITRGCHRNTFTSPKCFFCECNQNGTVNENSCLESECMTLDNRKYALAKDSCSPGEMVSQCTECLCLRNGLIDPKYCTSDCSHQQKLLMLERGIKDSTTNHRIIDKGAIQKAASNDACEPNSIYLDEDRYCLCPDNGNTKFKLCASIDEKTEITSTKDVPKIPADGIDFTAHCDPSTFVEFQCNTCYCLKSGKLDPNWCTYDDCEAKKIIQERHKQPDDVLEANGSCIAGSIIKEHCNFCICPDNGQLKDKACTKNSCAGLRQSPTSEKLSCEPLLYYNVDCNICYCPKNGLKNVARCTKNICEKNFLRSEVCVPGDLFSDDCNVCVCPPNGDKSDRVCTNHTCSVADTPWKKIFKLSQSLFGNLVTEDTTRSLELCFPGEEFEVGCKLCVCPDMGLRVYATCTHMLCNEDRLTRDMMSIEDEESRQGVHSRTKRHDDMSCMTYNLTDSSEKKECTPGSIYIIRCKQCICPYMGSINHFCRPLPKGTYCEQAYPGYNYMPVGRRTKGKKNSTTTTTSQATEIKEVTTIRVPHNHTTHSCDKPGRLTDDCFICDCEDYVLIEEHCFKSEDEGCIDRKPSFIKDNIVNFG